jgi:preprotein translocase SecE subunit
MATDRGATNVRPRPQQSPRPGGFIHKTNKYLSEVVTELKKATWPGRPELISQTKIVLGVLMLIGVFIAVWDMVLGLIFQGLLRLMGVSPGV